MKGTIERIYRLGGVVVSADEYYEAREEHEKRMVPVWKKRHARALRNLEAMRLQDFESRLPRRPA